MNAPFNRTVIHPREKPLSSDHNQLQSDLDWAVRYLARELLGGTDAFLANGLKVVAQSPAAMAVNVSAGLGFQSEASLNESGIDAGSGAVVGLNDLDSFKPLPLLGIESFTISAAPSAPNTRIDIIEVRADRLVTDSTSRQILNTGTGEFEPNSRNKTIQWALDDRTGTVVSPANSTEPLSMKRGVAANPGVAPATSPGYIKLAEVLVGSAVTTIDDDDITDFRTGPASLATLLSMEEGVFTPVVLNNGAAHGSYTRQDGSFTRIGKTVFFQLAVTALAMNPAGTLAIDPASLPYLPSNDTVSLGHAVTVAMFAGDTLATEAIVGRATSAGIFLAKVTDGIGTPSWASLGSDNYSISMGGHYLIE